MRRCNIRNLIDFELHFIHQVFLAAGDSEGNFCSSIQAATCLPHTVEASHCPFLLLNVKM